MDFVKDVRVVTLSNQPKLSTQRYFLLLLVALVFAFVSAAFAQTTNHPLVGAIRWDGFMGPPDYVGIQEEANMSALVYHNRIPFNGVELSSTSAQAREITQPEVDQDCGYAQQAGINYWAFDYYPPYYLNPQKSGPDLSTPLTLYRSSTNSSCKQLKFALVLATGYVDSNGNDNFQTLVPTIISYFQGANYQTVLGGRPLIYIFSSNLTAADVSYLRAQSSSNPYIVDMNGSGGASSLGADAVSAYVTTGGGGEAYANLASSEQSSWPGAGGGYPIIPWATLGWDPRPRINTPNVNPAQYSDQQYYPSNGWVQWGQPAQSADEVQQAINWTNNNPTADPSNTILVYAWDELTEGSNLLMPTLYNGTQMVQAMADVLVNTNTANVALNQTYSASSTYSNQSAADAFDGNESTNWQAALGTNYSQQWLECDFSTLTTFNQVIVSEYHSGGVGRTTGFVIQDWDGSGWQTVYTGTKINDPTAPSPFLFPSVTSTKVRLAFTSGSYTPIIYEMQVHNTRGTTNLGIGKSYSSSSQWNAGQAAYWAFNGGNWQSASGSNFNSDWLECDFGVPTTFDKILLNEGYNRTSSYEIDYTMDGSNWTTAYQGGAIGSNATITFPPVTGVSVRLKFNSGQYTPIIYSFQIYNQ